MNLIIFLLLTISTFTSTQIKETVVADGPVGTEVSFTTTDGIKIYGDFYVVDKSATTILLFHQGGSNARAVYSPIIPRLLDEGYNLLAIDQRVGGKWYGSNNRTVDNLLSNEYEYCDALPDLQASIKYIKSTELTGEIVLWGGSYSAALVIKLLAINSSGITSALAFSPSSNPEKMKDCHPNSYMGKVKIPLLMLRPETEMNDDRIAQFEHAKEYGHETYIATNGVHASSMLVEERVDGDVEKNWGTVLDFLKRTSE